MGKRGFHLCTKCGAEFTSWAAVTAHMVLVHGGRP